MVQVTMVRNVMTRMKTVPTLSMTKTGRRSGVDACMEAPLDTCKRNQPLTAWWQPSKSVFSTSRAETHHG